MERLMDIAVSDIEKEGASLMNSQGKSRYIIIALALLFFIVFGINPTVFCYEEFEEFEEYGEYEGYEEIVLRGKVIAVQDITPTVDYIMMEQSVEVEVTSGEYKGHVFTVDNALLGNPYYDIYLEQGNEILLLGVLEEGLIQEIYFQEVIRDKYIYFLIAVFIVILLLVGRVKGVKTLAALVFTGVIIIKVMLPLILKGYSPIIVSLFFAGISAVFTLFMVGGWGKKTLAAVAGTLSGVTAAGFLALLTGRLAHLTGFSSEEAQMLMYMENVTVDIQGLLFAGIMIGCLGAVTDVGISISSAVSELKERNPELSSYDLMTSGMNIGRDIMGTMANTLILAYVGSATPLLLLLIGYEMPWIKISNLDLMATEIVRSMAGSIGLVITIPATAAAAAWLNEKMK